MVMVRNREGNLAEAGAEVEALGGVSVPLAAGWGSQAAAYCQWRAWSTLPRSHLGGGEAYPEDSPLRPGPI